MATVKPRTQSQNEPNDGLISFGLGALNRNVRYVLDSRSPQNLNFAEFSDGAGGASDVSDINDINEADDLRILLVEDDESHRLLVQRELKKAGLACTMTCVETRV